MTKHSMQLVVVVAAAAGAISGALVSPLVVGKIGIGLPLPQSPTQATAPLSDRLSTQEDRAVIDVVQRTNPAVVNITILKPVSTVTPDTRVFPFEDFFGPGYPFDFRFPGNTPDDGGTGSDELRQVGGGSGFVISPDGLIVTNRHVVDDEDATYTVRLADGTEYDARVLAKDQILDVAVIKIDAERLPTLALGNSDNLVLGQTVIAIGNVLAEFGNTVTRGVVSGIGRRVEAGSIYEGVSEVIEQAIQTDAAINPGNSGGPLLNLAGEVVGINTAVSNQGQSVGFAIPVNSVKKIIESVQKTGHIVRPWLGVRYIPVTPRVAEANKLSVTYGALVVSGSDRTELAVIPGSPADKAGIAEYDIILEINGTKLENKNSLAQIIGTFAVGDTITCKVLHNGKEKEVRITLEEMPSRE